jgi:penicillin-binding protein 1A
MGIRTKLSTNPAMILGGLEEGVTPLEMAYAYSTIANEGVRVSGSLAPGETGPVAFTKVEGNGFTDNNRVRRKRVYPAAVGQLAKDMLSTVVTSGTGKAAQVGDEFIWGKTGTTENYGDAWFAGGNEDLSVAIWVGYADRLQPMETEHGGAPVAGGTFPAEIFHDFMTSWLTLRAEREANRKQPDDDEGTSTIPAAPVTPSEIPPAEQAVPSDGAPTEPETGNGGGATPAPETPQQPPEQAPAPNPAPAPAPTPTTPPSTGDGTGGGVGAAPP